MTKDEAIELLEDLDGAIEDNHGRDYDEAFRMAIEALSAEPSDIIACEKVDELDMLERMYTEPCKSADQNGENVPSGDLISRENAIEAIEELDWYHINKNGEMVQGATSNNAWYKAKDIYKALNELPSVAEDVYKVINRLPSVDRPITKDTQCQEKNDHSGEVTEMVDLISREDAIEAVDGLKERPQKYYTQYNNALSDAVLELTALPSADRPVNPNSAEEQIAETCDRPKGEWVVENHEVVCSVCGQNNLETNFCPNCGADMRSEFNE